MFTSALISVLLVLMISRIAAFPTNVHHSHHHRCDCSTQGSRHVAPTNPNVITCERPTTDITSPNLIKQLVWKTRKDGLLRSTTIEVLDMIQQEQPSSVIITQFDSDLIGESFYQQLPRIPDLILSDVSIPNQIRHLRQMQSSVLNATALVRKILQSIDQERSKYRSNVPEQYYRTLEFALTHVYCPISQLLGLITTNSDMELEVEPSSFPPDASYLWECRSKKHCLEMERTMLRRLDEVYDQVTKNLYRIQESAALS